MIRNITVLVSVIAALMVMGTSPVVGASDPSPQIIEVSYPSLVYDGQKATITVTAKNNGVFTDDGYISVSFPNDEDILESDVYGTGNNYNDLYPKGYWPLYNITDQQMISVDPLVELHDTNWGGGQEESITLSVSPTGAEQIVFYVRVALKNSEGTFIRAPASSSYIDQQGWCVNKYTIDVVYPPPLLWKYKTDGYVYSVDVSSDGNYVAAGSSDNHVYLFDETGNLLWREITEGRVDSVSISSDGNYVAAGSSDNHVYLFDKAGNRLLKEPTDGYVNSVSISSDGNYIAAGSSDNHVYLFNKAGNRLFKEPTDGSVNSVSISNDGNYVAAGSSEWWVAANHSVYLFDKAGNQLWKEQMDGGASSVSISSDGDYVASGTRGYMIDNSINYFNKGGTKLWNHSIGTYKSAYVSVSDDGNYIAAGSRSEYPITVYFFNKAGNLLWKENYFVNPDAVRISSDGNSIAVGSGHYIYLFDSFAELQIPLDFVPEYITTGDMDGNGRNDIIASDTNQSNPVMNLYNQQSDHTFVGSEFFDDGEIASVSIGDIDDDGFEDVAGLYGYLPTEYAYSGVRVWYQNGDGFGSYVDITFDELYPNSLSVDDLNDDGLNDIAIIGNGNISIFYQQVDHTFNTIPDYTLIWDYSSWPFSIVTGDINGDELNDIAAGHCGPSFSGVGISFFHQTEGHSFVAAPFGFGDINTMLSASIGDLNNDELNDIAIARFDYFGSAVLIYYQKEDHTFNFADHPQDADKIILTDSPVSISVCDLNDDGLDDIAVGNRDSEMISIYYQKKGDGEPDLNVTNIEFSTDCPREGEPVTMSVTIENEGTGTAYNVPVTFYQWADFSSDFGHTKYSDLGFYYIDPIYPLGRFPHGRTHTISKLEAGNLIQIDRTWDAVPIYDLHDGNIRVGLKEIFSIDDKSTNITIIGRSHFWPEIDGYHFTNWGLTGEELKFESIKLILRKYYGGRIAKVVFNSMEPDLFGFDGHCHGMSTASILYYNNASSKPINKRTFEMMKNEPDVKDDIINYQTTQLFHTGVKLISMGGGFFDLTGQYKKITDHVKDDDYQPILLCLWNTSELGGHAVVAINTFDVSENIKNVVVYDNNYPGMATVVQFNLASNTINYRGFNRAYALHVDSDIEKGMRVVLDLYIKILLGELIDNKLNLLIVDCPVNVTITDQYDRVINDDGINEIPNAEVVTGGDAKLFYLPADLTYAVNIDAYDSGNFTLTQLAPLTNESASITSFTNIQVNSTTKASVIIDPTEVHDLKIDNDGDGTTDKIKEPDSIETIGQTSIQLHTGWNLVSLPLMLVNTSVVSALSPISGNYSIIWEYNASDTTDNWKKYDPSAPFGNDLTEMEPGKGYWILMTSDDTLHITGNVPESTDINLKTGWTDHWKKYDPNAPFGNDLTDMEPGKGYWILVNSDGTLEI